jgi:hypothetical protein
MYPYGSPVLTLNLYRLVLTTMTRDVSVLFYTPASLSRSLKLIGLCV